MEPAAPAESSASTAVSIIGRPNVGKSSLFNRLAKKQQALVHDQAGTTRDINRVNIKYKGRSITLIDSAGMRRPGKLKAGVEKFSVLRAIEAIEMTDISLLVLDATEPGVALEQKLAGMIKDAGNGLIIIINKWDLAKEDEHTFDRLVKQLQLKFAHVPWAPLVVTSAKTGHNVTKIYEMVAGVDQRRHQKLTTSELNRWLAEVVIKHPPAGYKRSRPKLRYITQTGTNPPEFSIFGHRCRLLHWSYKRYLERTLRQSFDFSGTPVIINFKDSEAP